MIYAVILFLLIILSVHYDIQGKTRYRDEWYNIILVIFILVAGLRWRFAADTINYMYNFYHATPYLQDLTVDRFIRSGQPPLWMVLNSVVKTLGGKFFVVQLIQAAIVNTLLMKYFKKHSPYPFACVVLYFFWRYQYFNMMIMKAATALSILIYANDYFLEKKYKKGVLLVLIATGFHQSSILLLMTPFLTFLRFNMLGIMILISTYFVGAILQSYLGDLFDLLEFAEGVQNKLENYEDSDFMTQNRNLNYFILRIFPIIIYPLLALLFTKLRCKDSTILKLEPFVMLGLVFQVMQFNIHIFYRFVYIYYPYYIIFIIHFFIVYSKRTITFTRSLSYTRTFVIVLPFIVSLLYAYRPFTGLSYNPYSSVIERSVDKEREKHYREKEDFPRFNENEY